MLGQKPTLIQALHHIQEESGGWLPREKLLELARRTQTHLYRIQEVASFFPHFRLSPPPAVTVQVCRDLTCHFRGSSSLLGGLAGLMVPGQVSIEGVSCLGRCDRAPAAMVNDQLFVGRSEAELRAAVAAAKAGEPLAADADECTAVNVPGPWAIDPYAGETPDYRAVRAYVANPDPGQLLKALEVADLRGMGGAGVWAFRKWTDVRQAAGDEKYVIVNGDESEPGTFKDRELLLRTPHLVLEGLILAALVTGATRGWVYIRHEYQEQIRAMRRTIAAAQKLGACGRNVFGSGRPFQVEVFVSPGGYICGEMSALIEAMSDRRAEPRNKPPQIETNGLYDKPTLVSNVETYAWVPGIALKGGEWYRDMGRPGCKGARFFSISGDVNRPGVYEVPNGIPLRELIELAGGMAGGRALKAFAPSGPSGGFLPAQMPLSALARGFDTKESTKEFAARCIPRDATHMDLLDLPMDLQVCRDLGIMLGAGVVVYGPAADMVAAAVNATEFYRNESCGKCVPCRIGSQKLVEIGTDLIRRTYDAARFEPLANLTRDLGRTLELTSICGLGAVAANPLVSVLRFFPEDVSKYLGRPVRAVTRF